MFDVLQDGHPTLRLVSQPHEIGPDTASFLKELHETMVAHRGAGLAAPQVGILTRVFVTSGKYLDGSEAPKNVINPTLVGTSDKVRSSLVEGCLSFDIANSRMIERSELIFARWEDEHGTENEGFLYGFAARVFQHELDHLNGVLISDYWKQRTDR